MSQPKSNEWMEKIVSLCKRRGFVFQSSEIYGGLNGFWDYGPLGAELKRNVKELWWRRMVHEREDVAGLEATIIMHPQIWKASGHVDTFSDPMSTCRHCKKLIRSDQGWEMLAESPWGQAIAELCPDGQVDLNKLRSWAAGKGMRLAPNLALVRNQSATLSALEQRLAGKPGPMESRELLQYLATEKDHASGLISPCPHCGGELTAPRPFNLMFKTYIGPVADEENVAYLRPETAQAIFAQFKNVLETSRQQVPFGVAQVGKAFRNEVTPRNFTFRSREFEQMELEFFIKPDEVVEAITGKVTTAGAGHPGEPQPGWGWQTWHKYWVEERIRFYEGIGLPRTTLEEYWQKPEELAHYARATVDILFKFPFGTQELEGIAARGDFDLSQHERFTGKPMGVFDEEL
ncbi:MAG TPA: glycine--tRNA ligase, partial [Candidatus Saccharimonadales bacterium]|nr:glycine--tRNA ligase [Candidatus Saccharimonadales bacterium]